MQWPWELCRKLTQKGVNLFRRRKIIIQNFKLRIWHQMRAFMIPNRVRLNLLHTIRLIWKCRIISDESKSFIFKGNDHGNCVGNLLKKGWISSGGERLLFKILSFEFGIKWMHLWYQTESDLTYFIQLD